MVVGIKIRVNEISPRLVGTIIRINGILRLPRVVGTKIRIDRILPRVVGTIIRVDGKSLVVSHETLGYFHWIQTTLF